MLRTTRTLALVTAGLAALWLTSVATAANSNVFSGRATALQGSVLTTTLPPIADTGEVSGSGGELEASLLCYPSEAHCAVNVPDLTDGQVAARVLHAAVVAQGNRSHAEADVARFGVNVGGQTISGKLLMANADVICSNGTAVFSGSADIVGLAVNGVPIDVTGGVNQTIPLPLGQIVLNEQTTQTSLTHDYGSITVTALHIMIPGVADIVVAQAHADLLCATPPPPPSSCVADKVTGGGFVPLADDQGSFAVAARTGGGWGHLLFINHKTGDRFKATEVGPLTFLADGTAMITGKGEINGDPGHDFTAKVKDNGEPGRNDTFGLTTDNSNLTVQPTLLGGGNIQYHRCK